MQSEMDKFQLKEASVVLTKLNEKTLPSYRNTYVLDENALTETLSNISLEEESNSNDARERQLTDTISSSRKRRRKNSAPQRKIIRTDNFIFDSNENSNSELGLFSCASGTIPSAGFSGDDDDAKPAFPYIQEWTISCSEGNNNAKKLVKEIQNDETNNEEGNNLRFTPTPIFVKKVKNVPAKNGLQSSPENKSPLYDSASTLDAIRTTTENTVQIPTSETRTKRKITKNKKGRSLPNILSRKKKKSPRSALIPKSNRKSEKRLVEIRPKATSDEKLTVATRAAFEKTLNTQMIMPLKSTIVLPALDRNSVSMKVEDNRDDSDRCSIMENKTECTVSTPCVNTPAYIPLTINPNKPDVKPQLSKPQYRSRLQSKSGTKYIVRKDSIITANLSDVLDSTLSKNLSLNGGHEISLKLHENNLDEKNFYNTFVKKMASPDTSGKQHEPIINDLPAFSSLQNISVCTESPKVKSPVLDHKHVSQDQPEVPVRLFSKGGLDDVKREMNIVNPSTWNILNDQHNFTTEKNPNTSSAQVNQPYILDNQANARFLANLQARFMPQKKSSYSCKPANLINAMPPHSNNANATVKTFSLQSNHQSGHIHGNYVMVNKDGTVKKQSNTFRSEDKNDLQDINNDNKSIVANEIKRLSDEGKRFKQSLSEHTRISPIKFKYTDNRGTILKGTDQELNCNVKLELPYIKQEIDCPKQSAFTKEHTPVTHSTMTNGVQKHEISSTTECSSDSQKIKEEKVVIENNNELIKEDKTLSHEIQQEQTFNDHAYTRFDAPQENVGLASLGKDLRCKTETLDEASDKTHDTGFPNMEPVPVYAVRCGEKVVLFPISKAINLGTREKKEIVLKPRSNTPVKNVNKTPTKSVKKEKPAPYKPVQMQIDFAEKHQLGIPEADKTKRLDEDISSLVTVDYRTVMSKRSRNHLKHMCAVIVHVSRTSENKFSLSKETRALTLANGSNPFLVRWHDDGIRVIMATFNGKSKIQHLTVDNIKPGFYCLTLKGDNGVRKNKTLEGLITSTLPSEELLLTEKDFLAICEIKNIMDPTIAKLKTLNYTLSGLGLKETLKIVLSSLGKVCTPTASDRSYRPKVDDKTWYSAEKYDIFTKIYGRKRGFQIDGSRLPGEIN